MAQLSAHSLAALDALLLALDSDADGVFDGTWDLRNLTLLSPQNFNGQYYVSADASITDHSLISTTGSLANIINVVSSAEAVVVLPAATTLSIVTTDVIVPKNITLKFQNGCVIDTGSGRTLTINGDIEAGPRTIFSGAGNVLLSNSIVDRVIATWFGLNTTETGANNATYLENAASASTNKTLFVPDGEYAIDVATITNKIHLELSNNATLKHIASATGTMLTFDALAAGSTITGGTFDGNKDNNAIDRHCIKIDAADMVIFKTIIQNVSYYGLFAYLSTGGINISKSKFIAIDNIALLIEPSTFENNSPIVINDNLFDNWSDGDNAETAIFVNHDTNNDPRFTNVKVTDNTVRKTYSSTGSTVDIRGAKYVLFRGNHCFGGARSTISHGTDTIVEENLFMGQTEYCLEINPNILSDKMIVSTNVLDGRGLSADGIRITGTLHNTANQLKIIGNSIKGCTGRSLQLKDETGVIMVGNSFDGAKVLIAGQIGAAITSNIFSNSVSGIEFWPNTQDAQGITIADNEFKTLTYGIGLYSSTTNTLKDFTLTGNIFNTCTHSGLYFTEAGGGPAEDFTVTGNVFKNCGAPIKYNANNPARVPSRLIFKDNIGAAHVVSATSSDPDNHRLCWAEHVELNGFGGSDTAYLYDGHRLPGHRCCVTMTHAGANMTLQVFTHSSGSYVNFVFTSLTDYLVLEWTGYQWITAQSIGFA